MFINFYKGFNVSILDVINTKNVWTEDQADLLKFSLHNIFQSLSQVPRYNSSKFFLSIPINLGYRFFNNFESNSIEEILFMATELLMRKNLGCVNLETDQCLPILKVRLEPGPTIIVEDIVTDKILCQILL
jgi:hypothetical protein